MDMQPPIPIFRIFDEAKAREFYLDFLGFAVNWEHRFEADTPLYMEVARGNCRLHLSEHFGDATPGSSIRVEVSDIEALHTELSAKEYRHARPGLDDTPYNTREVKVSDPFGNRLIFYVNV